MKFCHSSPRNQIQRNDLAETDMVKRVEFEMDSEVNTRRCFAGLEMGGGADVWPLGTEFKDGMAGDP